MTSSKSRPARTRQIQARVATTLLGLALLLGLPGTAPALAPEAGAEPPTAAASSSFGPQGLLPAPPRHAGPPLLADVDMRDDGYNPEYIFGLTKGVANSTMTPALKPFCFILTVPLDLVTLPFAAIGGFF